MPQHVEVHEGARASAHRPQRERGDQQAAADDRQEDIRTRESAIARHVREAPEQRDQTGGEQQESHDVQPRARAGLVPRQQPPGQEQSDQAERHVDQEQPLPAAEVQDDAADHRSQDRSERGRQGDGRHQLAKVRGTACCLDQDRHHQREHGSAAESLHDAEGDEAGRVPGEGAEHRSEQEEGEGSHPEALAAELALQPADQRDRDSQREQIARRDPLDRRDARVEVDGQLMQRDAHDGRVEDDRDAADDDRDRGAHERGVELAVVGRGGGGCGHLISLRYERVSNFRDATPRAIRYASES